MWAMEMARVVHWLVGFVCAYPYFTFPGFTHPARLQLQLCLHVRRAGVFPPYACVRACVRVCYLKTVPLI